MNADIEYMIGMTSTLPAVVGLYRYNRIDRKFHPFVYMMILIMIIETVQYIGNGTPAWRGFAAAALNVYMVLSFVLFLYFVYRNSYIKKLPVLILVTTALLVGVFNFVYSGTVFGRFYYLLCYVSIVMLVISIDILSRQVMEISSGLYNNCWFWLSSFFILYNAVTLLVFGCYVFALFNTPGGKAVVIIQDCSVLICYIFYTVAIIKMPGKALHAGYPGGKT